MLSVTRESFWILKYRPFGQPGIKLAILGHNVIHALVFNIKDILFLKKLIK